MLRMRQDYEDTIVMLGMKEYQQVLKKFKEYGVPLAKKPGHSGRGRGNSRPGNKPELK